MAKEDVTVKALSSSIGKATLATKALAIAKAALIGGAIIAGIWALGKAWDYVNVTVEEQSEKVEELQSKYGEPKDEYTALSEKQDLTQAEKNRLDYLQRRLELDEKILKTEQKRLDILLSLSLLLIHNQRKLKAQLSK